MGNRNIRAQSPSLADSQIQFNNGETKLGHQEPGHQEPEDQEPGQGRIVPLAIHMQTRMSMKEYVLGIMAGLGVIAAIAAVVSAYALILWAIHQSRLSDRSSSEPLVKYSVGLALVVLVFIFGSNVVSHRWRIQENVDKYMKEEEQ